MKRRTLIPIIVLVCLSTTFAVTSIYSTRVNAKADLILELARQLRNTTHAPAYDSGEAQRILAELKESIAHYESDMIFMESPYPGEIFLGKTPRGDDTWVEILCDTRFGGRFKEIRIRRTGQRSKYLRINDIELTYITPRGPQKITLNQNARTKLYRSGVFQLSLPRPMRLRRIRIRINHKTTGLEIYGIPFESLPVQPREIVPMHPHPHQQEILLGTTPPGKDTWLQTLVSSPYHRPIKAIRLKRTGQKAKYLRINDIEITHLTPHGRKTTVFNKGARAKLYFNDVFELSLPRPMNIIKIKVNIAHQSTGLEVYAKY